MRSCHQLLRRQGYSQRAQNAHSVKWVFVFSLSAHLRTVARTIIFPCLPLAYRQRSSFPPARRGGKIKAYSGLSEYFWQSRRSGINRFADGLLFLKSFPLRQGLREWLAFVSALPCAVPLRLSLSRLRLSLRLRTRIAYASSARLRLSCNARHP